MYGLGSEGHVLSATKSGSFVASQPTQLQLTVDDIVAAPAFKTALAQILDERDRQNVERQHESEQQMHQLQAQLAAVLNTLTAFGTQGSNNFAPPTAPNVENPPTNNASSADP